MARPRYNTVKYHWPIEAEWHIYASVNYVNIGSDNGLSPGRRQAIIWTIGDILSIRPYGTYFNVASFEIQIVSFKKMQFEMLLAKWRLFCLGVNVLTTPQSSPLKVM